MFMANNGGNNGGYLWCVNGLPFFVSGPSSRSINETAQKDREISRENGVERHERNGKKRDIHRGELLLENTGRNERESGHVMRSAENATISAVFALPP